MYFNVDFDLKLGVFQEYHILPCNTITFWLTCFDQYTPQIAYFKPGHPEYTRIRRFIKNRKTEFIDGEFELENNSNEKC